MGQGGAWSGGGREEKMSLSKGVERGQAGE